MRYGGVVKGCGWREFKCFRVFGLGK